MGSHVGQTCQGIVDHAELIKRGVLVSRGIGDIRSHIQPLVDLRIKISTECGTFEGGAHGDTILIQITAGDRIVHILCSSIDIQLMVMHECCTEQLILPVGTVC